MKRYFSYSADGGFELHDSLDEAKTAAEKEFEICRDELRRIVKRHERQASAQTPGE